MKPGENGSRPRIAENVGDPTMVVRAFSGSTQRAVSEYGSLYTRIGDGSSQKWYKTGCRQVT